MPHDAIRQAALAQAQQESIRKRVFETCKIIMLQVKNTYDTEHGRCRYLIKEHGSLVEKRFTEAEFLRRAHIDKNTIKRSYHADSRKRVTRLISWVKGKCARPNTDNPRAANAHKVVSTAKTPLHALIAIERDEIAEKFAILEWELSSTIKAKRALENQLDAARKELEDTRKSVAGLTDLLLRVGSSTDTNVVPITGGSKKI